jgi:hypothetical protein
METLCSVNIPVYGSDQHDDIVDRARGAFTADPGCQSAGVVAAPKSTSLEIEDYGSPDTLELSAPGAVGRGLFVASISDPSAPGAPGLCQRWHHFPGYATNQLDIMDTTFSTAASGAAGGSVTFVEVSPLGRCSITVPTTAGEAASAIAQNILAAYQAAYTTDSVPDCPYASNPGDLVATTPFVPLAPGTLNSIASTELDVCINDTGVGVTTGPNGVPILDATLTQAALFATNQLTLQGVSAIREGTGGYALVANSGTGALPATVVGPDVTLGSIVSEPPVVLGPADTITGRIKSAGAVTVGPHDTIGGAVTSSASVSLPGLTQYQVTFPTQFAPGVVALPFVKTPLAPGAYEFATITTSATLVLTTGTYYFTNIELLPLASILIDDSAGPVVVYVRDAAVMEGSLASKSGGAPRLRFVYEGKGALVLSSPLSGTFVAPNATMDLTPSVHCTYRGSFFAENIIVNPLADIVHLPAQ